jgi:hypothetical protein
VEIAPILTIIFNKSVQSQLVLFHQTGELPMSLLCTKKVKNITLKTIIVCHNSIDYVKEECETLSKAFEKSMTKISVCFPFSMLRVTSSINYRS